MLTKKDFIKVAEILNEYGKSTKQFNELVSDFVKWFKSENKDFNEDKFREAVLKE